jgi:hypothetical protein
MFQKLFRLAARRPPASQPMKNAIWFRAGRASETNPAAISGKLSLMERNQDRWWNGIKMRLDEALMLDFYF